MPSVSPRTPRTDSNGPRRVAVLGGTGHIGRVLCDSFAERGDVVVAFARTVPTRPTGVRFIPLDVVDTKPEELAAVLEAERFDVVVNAIGGVWSVPEEGMVRANITVVERLLEALARMADRPRLVHLGSVHEYGLVPVGVSIDESTEPAPEMGYGKTKLRGTELVLAACERGDVDAVILRISNTIGPGLPVTSLLGAVAAKLGDALRADRTASLEFASLQSARDFVDMRDAVKAIVAAAGSDVSGQVVNIGRGEAVTARVVVDLLIEASGVRAEVVEGPVTAPETTWQQMNVANAARSLGWKPGYELSEAIGSLWDAYIATERIEPAP
ncbi:NAD-dependent epimerase/dehydratase family protein [Embleya hyalina]|uniref:Reductase n=1 Tax=Embleya hyalina TaxID=516124 RepID=A0A401YI82_9ACTN|nr:NAD(P)-dependent oxidoreductase [Embleya hyalina]GCD94307.1 reductase [Embleya hyalina]